VRCFAVTIAPVVVVGSSSVFAQLPFPPPCVLLLCELLLCVLLLCVLLLCEGLPTPHIRRTAGLTFLTMRSVGR